MFPSVSAAYRSPTFMVQCFVTMAINFGINFGLEWAQMSEWGKKASVQSWPGISVWRLDTPVNSCIALDILVSAFSIGFLCTLLATGGTQKEVRDKKCEMLPNDAATTGYWLLTPVPIVGLFPRSLATGIYVTALFGVPTLLLSWAAVGSGYMRGFDYTVFKGIWAMIVAGIVYAMVFPAAINVRNFPETEFEELVALANSIGADAEDFDTGFSSGPTRDVFRGKKSVSHI